MRAREFLILFACAAEVAHRLDVKPDGRDGGNDLAQLELVEDGRLARGVEPHHEDAHVLLPEELGEKLANAEAHG